nr:TonB-dependent receptor [Massilia sp. CFBP 13647]
MISEETMTKNKLPSQRKATCVAVSAAVLIMGAQAPAAQAQTQTQAQAQPQTQAGAQGPAAPDGTVSEEGQPIHQVKVVATRASQQSSIDRKKNAATAIDSIVAEDVGSLPDRNIGEAISRIAGISLDRGEFGEGVSVAVRGNGPDLTRVELDGQAVQSPGGSDFGETPGEGRAVEFRQLSADLIKSVDVVKGSTADMTEGALGGGIIIKTRTGLDFKKPFASLRVAATQGNLNKKWEPDANLILSNKFMDGRLGVLVNASSTTLHNEGHVAHVSGARQGYYRIYDFDNSPEKTFTFQPGTVNMDDPSVHLPLTQSALTGGGFFNSATPLDLITRSAQAQSKEACNTTFPALTTAELNRLTSGARTGAQNARSAERNTCLNQWNDYTPSGPRYAIKREIDRRKNLDLRADFKVNNELTVYAKGSYNKRHNDLNQLAFSMGNFSIPNGVVNVEPGSVVVDANHHVTQYTFNNTATNGVAKTDQMHGIGETSSRYLQLGGSFKRGGLSAEFFVGDARSDFKRGVKNLSFNDYYGSGTLNLLPNGLWGYTFPGYDPTDNSSLERFAMLYPRGASAAQTPNQYLTATVPAYTAAQQNAVTSSPNVTWAPQIRESGERTAKVDLVWRTDVVPFFKSFKGGLNLRDTTSSNWSLNGSGYVLRDPIGTYGKPGYVAPLVLPSPTLRSTLFGCADTPGSLAPGGNACQYGWIPKPDIRQSFDGSAVMTMAQFADMLKQTMTMQATPTRFFNGASDRPEGLIENWTQIDLEKIFTMLNIPNANFDCVKRCTANDGKVYDQPSQLLKERTESFYLMGNFGLDHIPFTTTQLPFGLELEGNLGVRYVRTKIQGSGRMQFTSIHKTAAYNPITRDDAAGIVTTRVQQYTETKATTSDVLPSLNLATWLVPDKLVVRYSAAKTVARPPVSRLLASGACVYDERLEDENDEDATRCTSVVGNPALQAQRNLNQNLSVEWYPNRDTSISIAGFRQQGKIGGATTQAVPRSALFAGTNLTDPATGASLADLLFDYSTWINGAVTGRKGVEYSTRTAFTFLPWRLRYTGFDANYSKMHSATTTKNIVDLLTGTPLPPQNEPKYTYNAAVWYDDGKLSARVALQAVAMTFDCIANCGQTSSMNNYPNVGGGRIGVPYNPGSPVFKDATRYIDAKIAYKFNPNVEVFVEGRNLGNATTTLSQGPYTPFADGTPVLLNMGYSGRRMMVGVNFRTM